MRDQQRDGATLSAGLCDVALEELVFCLRVECCSGFVEDEEERLGAHHAAGDREALPLPAGKLDTCGPRAAELRRKPLR